MNLQEQNDREVLLRERCMAYLLGDMTVEQSSMFESELDDPTIAAAMQRESDLLCCLATSEQLASVAGDASTAREQDTLASDSEQDFAINDALISSL